MKTWIAVALLLALAMTPAHATQGLLCRPVSGSGPSLSLVIGSGAGSVIAGATLLEGRVTRSTSGARATLAIGQAWIDEQRVWLDLTDADAIRYEARLRAAWTGRGRARQLVGTLARNGRVTRVRCAES